MGWAVARARPEQSLLNRLLLPASEDSPASLAGGSGQRWGAGVWKWEWPVLHAPLKR